MSNPPSSNEERTLDLSISARMASLVALRSVISSSLSHSPSSHFQFLPSAPLHPLGVVVTRARCHLLSASLP
ncbi:hypothetical protein E2C01_045862 [Portunus trituberculatus]|uniref:Uncharacterized protein n=1 Tax=Portunus trituberculatus TaxID=210409 RepID=A0A5B7G437_PORTR|nr:hypothetical protein [Portunus trituberculatus]